MRILQVAPRYPPQTGGVETHVAAISERLAERGHEVTVLTTDAGAGGEDRETRGGVAVRRHRSLAPGSAYHLAPGIAPAVRRAEAEVVHAHNYHSLVLSAAALGVGGDSKGFVATPHYHGASASGLRDQLLRLYRPVGGWALRRTDAVVAVSDWERRQLRGDFGVDATVIPNGLDVERFAGASPEERDRPYLLCVGRLEAYKSVQHAVRALPELPEHELVVAGDGPHREVLEKLAAESGAEDRTTFLGYVGDDRLPGLYAGAEAHLALSEFEAYGMTVAEALAAGTPCVVRAAGALADWTDREGVVAIEDVAPGTIGTAVERAVGLEVDGDLPTWEDVCDRLLDVYRGRGAVE